MGATNPRSRSQSTKLRGKDDGNQQHPRQSLTDFIATEENK
jgi:aspartate carbamoyltransferase catalytic subunit